MKIVFVNKYAKITGGADTHCVILARELRARGHEVVFLSTADRLNVEREGAFVRRTVAHATRDRVRGLERLATGAQAHWNRCVAEAMRQLIADFRPDIIHTHKLYPQMSVAPVVIAHQAGVPIIQTAHDYEFISAHTEDETGGRIDRAETRLSFRLLNTSTFAIKRCVHTPRVARWVVASKYVAAAYMRRGIDCTVLPYCVEQIGGVLPARRRRGVLFSGRLVEVKGVRDVVGLAKNKPGLRVTIAGAGPLEEEVKAAARMLPNLHYAGFVEQSRARELVQNAEVLVVPSRWAEPGGIVALEAMAAGTPVVAYSNGGLAEYVTESGGGLVVPPDCASLETAVGRLLQQEELWHSLSRQGVEGVAALHSPSRYAADFEELCARIS